MNIKLLDYLNDFERINQKEADELISKSLIHFDFKLPEDYLEIIRLFNGQEGKIGEIGWLCLFPIEKLVKINQSYSLLMEQIPDLFLFGKDAADTGYAFHKTAHTYHSFGLMFDLETDGFDFSESSFLKFIEHLYNA